MAVTTITTLCSSLTLSPLSASAAMSKPDYIDDTTWQIMNLFGNVYDEMSYENGTNHVDSTINIEENQYRYFCNDVANGYTFTMSNFSDKAGENKQIIYRDGKEYDPFDAALGTTSEDIANGFINISNSDIVTKPDWTYAENHNWFTQGESDETTVIDGYSGYGIVLRESDKNNLSYLYSNVGQYKGHNVDVKLTVVDFDIDDDLILTDGSGRAMFEQCEYDCLNDYQKTFLRKLQNPITFTYKGETVTKENSDEIFKLEYGIPLALYSAASEAGVFQTIKEKSNGELNFLRKNLYFSKYYSALYFIPNEVGVVHQGLNWIKLRYDFYEAGTSKPINVKGYSCWKDIDDSQGVLFKSSENTIKKIGSWREKNNFIATTINASDGEYYGVFDPDGRATSASDTKYDYAWLYATFEGSSFSAMYTECGLYKGTTKGATGLSSGGVRLIPSNYDSTGRYIRKIPPSQLITNSLPVFDLTGSLQITKRINPLYGDSYIATTENNQNINKNLRFYLKDSKGFYVNLNYNDTTGAYVYNGTSDDISDESLAKLGSQDRGTSNNKTSINGGVVIQNLPIDTYFLYETATEGSDLKDKYDLSNVITVNMSQDNSGNEIEWDTTNLNDAGDITTKIINVDNPELQGSVSIQKVSTQSDGNIIDVSNTNLLSNIRFVITNSEGQYAQIENNIVTGFANSPSYFNLDSNGQATINTLPTGKYHIIEYAKNTNVQNIWNVEKTVDFTINANKLNIDVKIDNPELYGSIELYKVTDSGHDISDIKFKLTGTSLSGRKINETKVTDKSGNLKFEKVPVGTYTVEEIESSVPYGYAVSDPQTVIVESNKVTTVTVKNKLLPPCKITLTKRIPINEINGQVWFEHGNPTFIFKVENTTEKSKYYGRTYYKAIEFTEDYVANHTITIDDNKYVEMSVTFDNLEYGTYTAQEAVSGQRYKLKDILNVSDNGMVKNNQCEFSLNPGKNAYATFYNIKTSYDTNTHNSLCVNVIKE